MRIRKLPSGNWQVTVPIGKDNAGRYRYKSFTDKDKKAAVRRAADYQDQHREFTESVTVGDAVTAFLASQDGILSPGTIRGYTSLAKMLEERHRAIWSAQAHGLSRTNYQNFVNSLNAAGLSPKTIRNYIGLIGAALKAQDITPPSVSIPRRTKPEYHIPTENDVRRLAEAASGTSMEIPLTLAVLGLRRGEICALRLSDLSGNVLHIRRAVVYDADGQLQTKDPKTVSSDRFVQIPSQTAEKIRRQGICHGIVTTAAVAPFCASAGRCRGAAVPFSRSPAFLRFLLSHCTEVVRRADPGARRVVNFPRYDGILPADYERKTGGHGRSEQDRADRALNVRKFVRKFSS